jgi:hypothetical protein
MAGETSRKFDQDFRAGAVLFDPDAVLPLTVAA